ncbi:MAG: hypothetical protein H8D97_01280 [Proteobacteria bacterium]|nr:hypothetical protein [Pseudomonadota bacterium]
MNQQQQQMPRRTVFINHNNQKILLKFEIGKLIDNLVLSYEVHILKNNSIAPSIIETLKRSPEANIVNNDSIPLTLAFKKDIIPLGDVTETFLYIQGLVNEYANRRNEYIKAFIFGTTIHFGFMELYHIYTFLNNFINNYDDMKLRIFLPEKYIEQQPVREEEELPKINNDVLNEIFKLSPNKIINYYIIKWINDTNFSEIKNYDITKNELQIQTFLNFELFEFSKSNNEVLKELLDLINSNDREENVNKIKLLFRYIYSISDICKREEKISIENSVYLSIASFLIFMYGTVVYRVDIDDYIIKDLFEFIFKDCCDKLQVRELVQEDKMITFKIHFNERISSKHFEIESISEVSKKYNYLLKIDKDLFLNKVLSDIDNESIERKKKSDSQLEVKHFIGSPAIIDIGDFIIGNTESDGLLSYRVIDSKKNKEHTVLTNAYDQILFIEKGGKLKVNQINPIISKFSDIILNHIFKKINTNPELTEWSNINTLILMNEFIEPFIPKDTSEKTKRYILYQVIIPHLYNLYKINRIIDYFH